MALQMSSLLDGEGTLIKLNYEILKIYLLQDDCVATKEAISKKKKIQNNES